MPRSTFIYVSYIRTAAEKLWEALTEPDFQRQYWFGVHCESDWSPGSPWKMVHSDGHISDTGEIVESDPPRRLVIRWRHLDRAELKAEGEALCTMELEVMGPVVKLSITHTIQREHSKVIATVAGGWPWVISNLKSLLETGIVAEVAPASYQKPPAFTQRNVKLDPSRGPN